MSFSAKLLKILHDVFGLTALRPGEQEVIESFLHGRDTVAFVPTGDGKSLCYQLPGIVCGGLTLVVSPLISLIKDQSDHLLLGPVLQRQQHTELYRREQSIPGVISGESPFLFVRPSGLQPLTERQVQMVSGARVPIRFPGGETRMFLSRFVKPVGLIARKT